MSYSPTELESFRRCAFGRCRAAGAEVEDAEDCAQDAVAALLAHPGVARPKAWVATVAYHRYIDLCRLRQRENTVGLVPQPDTRPPALAGPEDEVVDRAHAHWLVRAMHVLPVSTRAVCLEVAGGGSHSGIAGRLGMTDRAVESHLTRARRSLRGLSLLTAAVVALGRLAHRASPAGKPLAAALVPSIVMALAIGGSTPSPGAGGDSPPGRPVPDAVPRVGAPPWRVPDEPGAAGTGPTAGGLSTLPPNTAPDTGPGTTRPSRTRIAVSPGTLPRLPLLPTVEVQLTSALPLPPVPPLPLPPAPVPELPPVPGWPLPGAPVPRRRAFKRRDHAPRRSRQGRAGHAGTGDRLRPRPSRSQALDHVPAEEADGPG